MLEREIQKVNKIIDLKIMRGEDYRKESRDHKLMLRRLRYHTKPSIWDRSFFRSFSF